MKAVLVVVAFFFVTGVQAEVSAIKAKDQMAETLVRALQSDIGDIRNIVQHSAYFYPSHRHISPQQWRGDIVCWEENFKARFEEIDAIVQSLLANYRVNRGVETVLNEARVELVKYCVPGNQGMYDQFTAANLNSTLDKIQKASTEIHP